MNNFCMNEITFIDLFAGIGGFRIALERCGCKCVFSSEIDTHCQNVYNENFGEFDNILFVLYV